MTITPSTLSPVVGASVKNVVHQPTAQTLPRKIVAIGGWDETTYPDLNPYELRLATSAEQVAAETGDGFISHRLARAAFKNSGNLEYWYVLVEADGAGVQATGTATFTLGGTAGAGTVYQYIGNDLIEVPVAAGATVDEIAAAVETAVNAATYLPVTASAALGVVTFTAKDAFTWGNEIGLGVNFGFAQTLPANVSVAFVAMSGGAGTSTMDEALAALGSGDAANEKNFTDLAHCWGQDSAALNELSVYNGSGDTFTGLYQKHIARPLRSLVGDNSSSLSTLITFADGRVLDRTSGVLSTYGSPEHPQEAAMKAIAEAAKINNVRAAEHYTGRVLSESIPGSTSDTANWTLDQQSRDTALKNGISVTTVEDNALKIVHLATFYRPASVPVTSNGYRSYSNLSKIQNMLASFMTNWRREKYLGAYAVESKNEVNSLTDQQKAVDKEDIYDDLIVLAKAFAGRGWLFNSAYTVGRLTSENLVSLRAGGTGFDSIFPCYLSGEAGVYNNNIEFDIDVSVLTEGA